MIVSDDVLKPLQDMGLTTAFAFDGCPCGEVQLCGLVIDVHCWRTGCCDKGGVHVTVTGKATMEESGVNRVARAIADMLSSVWEADFEWSVEFESEHASK